MSQSNHHLPMHRGHIQYPTIVKGVLDNYSKNRSMIMVARSLFPPPRTKDSFDDDDNITEKSSSGGSSSSSEKNQNICDDVDIVSNNSHKKMMMMLSQNGLVFPPPRTKDSFDDEPTEKNKKLYGKDEQSYPSQMHPQQLNCHSQQQYRSLSTSNFQQRQPTFPARRTKTTFDENPPSAPATKVQQQQQQVNHRVLPSATSNTNKVVSVHRNPIIVNTINSRHILELDEDEAKLIGRGVWNNDRNHQSKQNIHRMKNSQRGSSYLTSTNLQTKILKPKPLSHKDHGRNSYRTNPQPVKEHVPKTMVDNARQVEMDWQRQWLKANGNKIQPKSDSWWMRASNMHRPKAVKSKRRTSAGSKEVHSEALSTATPIEQSRLESVPSKSTFLPNVSSSFSNNGKSGLVPHQTYRHDKGGEIDRPDRKHWKKALLGKRQREIAAGAADESIRRQHWTPEEDDMLLLAVSVNASDDENIDWDIISFEAFSGIRSRRQCKQRWGLIQPGVNNGDWTITEDEMIRAMVQTGQSWSDIAKRLGMKRTREAIRARYCEHLDPNLKKTPWEPEEDQIIFRLQSSLGNRWVEISRHLPGRTANAVKNRFYNQLKAISRPAKKLKVER